jgi:hypothetical protein
MRCAHLEHFDCYGEDGFGSNGWLVHAMRFHVDVDAEGFATIWQLDERQKSSPPYRGMAFAIYGPISENGGSDLTEITRSSASKQRDNSEHITLKAGAYCVCIWNCDGVGPPPGAPPGAPSRQAAFMIHLAPASGTRTTGDREMNLEIHPEPIAPSNQLSTMAAICSTTSSPASQNADHGELKVYTAWLPDGGYGLVLGNKTSKELQVNLDFADSVGLQLTNRPQGGLKTSVSVPAGQEKFLGAQLRPDPSVTTRKATYRLGYSKS